MSGMPDRCNIMSCDADVKRSEVEECLNDTPGSPQFSRLTTYRQTDAV